VAFYERNVGESEDEECAVKLLFCLALFSLLPLSFRSHTFLGLGDQQSVRRAKPPQSDVWPHRGKTVVRVLEKFESPSGEGFIRVEDLGPPQKAITPARRHQTMVRAFRPVALEIGWIVFEWNRLHENLCELFGDFGRHRGTAFAVWHSTPSDRTQREMLKAAIAADDSSEHLRSKFRDDVLWLLEKMDRLAARRNDAIHAPLIFVNHSATGGFEVHIEPNDDSGNPRALQLLGKPLLPEFKWYRDHLGRLASFAGDLHYALRLSASFRATRNHIVKKSPNNIRARLDHFGCRFSFGRASVHGPIAFYVTDFTTTTSLLQIDRLGGRKKPKTLENTNTCVCGVNPIIGDDVDIRPFFSYIFLTSLTEGAFPEGQA
jgi:hypothetical protein